MKLFGLLIAGCFAMLISSKGICEETIPLQAGLVDPAAQKPLRNDPDDFRFVVFSDRTSQHRDGVFGDAVEKVNLLRPEFAVNIGDLIQGYTTTATEIAAMYKEVDGELRQLEIPFFRVPGNHDLGNSVVASEYLKRVGKPYWHFVYKNCLFLCVNTEDPMDRVGLEQIRYFRDVLQKFSEVRWTFVFMHKPLWVAGSLPGVEHAYKDSNWEQMEALLRGRDYTVFAGHTHHYWSTLRNGMKYFVLSTTGGARLDRGAHDYGELDHVVWVTMCDGGPKIANLVLSGILDEDLRSEEIATLQNQLHTNGVKLSAIKLNGGAFTNATSSLVIRNSGAFPVRMRVQFENKRQFRIEPSVVDRLLDSATSDTIEVQVKAEVPVDLEKNLPPILAHWTATTTDTLHNQKQHKFQGEARIVFEGRGTTSSGKQ